MRKTKGFLAENLAHYRVKLGLSQPKLAELADIPFPTLRDLEYGKSGGSAKTLSKIASAIGISVDDLLSDPNAPRTLSRIVKEAEIEQSIKENQKLISDYLEMKKEASKPKDLLGRVTAMLAALNETELRTIERMLLTSYGHRLNKVKVK